MASARKSKAKGRSPKASRPPQSRAQTRSSQSKRPRAASSRPEKLPPGFTEIWRALVEEQRRQPSRQVLAQRLGVSTQTLQRILVDGTVPDFRIANRRVRNAWARTLGRLARYFDREPRPWLEKAGIGWDAEIAGLVGATLPPAASAARRRSARQPEDSVAIQRAFPPGPRVGIVPRGVIAEPLYAFDESFLHVYARRILGAIVTHTELQIENMDEGQLLAALQADDSPVRIGIGPFETVARRAQGIDFVEIPGLRMRMGAVGVVSPEEPRPLPDWSAAVHPFERNRIRFLVTSGSVAHDHLLGVVRIAPERLILSASGEVQELAEQLLRESEGDQERTILLVSDEETCRGVIAAVESRAESRGRLAARMVPGFPEGCPAYPIAIAFPASAPGWHELLAGAIREEIFGRALRETAALYAEMALTTFFKSPLTDPLDEDASLGVWRIAGFPGASVEFVGAFCRTLLERLEDGALARLAGRQDLPGRMAVPRAVTAWIDFRAWVRELAVHHARNLVPAAWHGALDQALDERDLRTRAGAPPLREGGTPVAPRGMPPLSSPYCHSCATSLEVPHHRGLSDRFCRFCADKEGHLKPRDDVRRMLAAWVFHWTGTISREEAETRAARHMDVMPAWSEN